MDDLDHSKTLKLHLADLSRTESSPVAVKDYSSRMVRADEVTFVAIMAGGAFCIFPPIFFNCLFLVWVRDGVHPGQVSSPSQGNKTTICD